MKAMTVNIAEGKKGFSRLVQDAHNNNEEIVVTKRGKPMAVIISYENYHQSKRLEGYRKIMESREAFSSAGVFAKDIYREVKEELERRPWKE